ncbi:MAG: 50S ribosomal protein L29 [Bacteroidota bacterium]
MKANDIREMTTEEIQQQLAEDQNALQNLRFQHAIAALENSAVIKQKRRDIARMKTILQQRETA